MNTMQQFLGEHRRLTRRCFVPKTWPLPLGKLHWAALLPGLSAGEYLLRCRTIDAKWIAQPLPRPMRKSGHAAIETKNLVVK